MRTDEVMPEHWSAKPLLAGHGAAAHLGSVMASTWCFNDHYLCLDLHCISLYAHCRVSYLCFIIMCLFMVGDHARSLKDKKKTFDSNITVSDALHCLWIHENILEKCFR